MQAVDALEGTFGSATALFQTGEFSGDAGGLLLQALALMT